jgi:hypothetical protein
MRKASIVGFLSLIFIFSCSVMAQDDEERDVLEITLAGGLAIPGGGITDWNDGLDAATGWDFGIDFGYFFKDNITAGINFTYQQLNVDHPDASDTWHRLYNPNLYAKYYFPSESNWEPYVKAHVGLDNPKFTTFVLNVTQNRYRAISYDPALAFGFGLGLFYFTSDYSGLFLEANYHEVLASSIEAEYNNVIYEFNEDFSTININFGIRILIGSGD